MPVRRLESYIHDDTYVSLLEVYLKTLTVIHNTEMVVDLSVSAPNEDGVRTINFNLEREVDLIIHN